MSDTTPDPMPFEATDAGSVAPDDQRCSDAIDDAGLDQALAAGPPEGVDSDRYAAMIAAASAIGSTPVLDDVTRARLVRGALAALDVGAQAMNDDAVPARSHVRTSRTQRWMVPIGAVAAAAALVIGVASLAGNSGDDPDAPFAGSASVEVDDGGFAPDRLLPDLGDVTDPGVLRDLVLVDTKSDVTALGAESAEGPLETPVSGGRESAPPLALPSSECLASLDPEAEPVVIATATFNGAPAVVATSASATSMLVFVLGGECTILSSLQIANDTPP